MSPPPNTFAPNSVLINGQGNYTKVTPDGKSVYFACNTTGPLADPNCSPGTASVFRTNIDPSPEESKTYYKYRIINTAVTTHLAFWIDGHDFWVVSTDFVPIKPLKRAFLHVAIGESKSVVHVYHFTLIGTDYNCRSTLRHYHRGKNCTHVGEEMEGQPKFLDKDTKM